MAQGKTGPQWGEKTVQGLIVGRNQAVVPPEEVADLAQIGCSDRDIAEWFGITESTLRYNFSDYLIKGRGCLKQTLRRAQLRVALDGNPTLLIWLGKAILGQRENPVDIDENKPLPWTDDETEEILDEISDELDLLDSTEATE